MIHKRGNYDNKEIVQEDNVKLFRMTVTGVITIIRRLKMLERVRLVILNINLPNSFFKSNKFLVLGCLRHHKGKKTSTYFQIVQSVNADMIFVKKNYTTKRFWTQNFTQKVRKSRQWQIYDKSA